MLRYVWHWQSKGWGHPPISEQRGLICQLVDDHHGCASKSMTTYGGFPSQADPQQLDYFMENLIWRYPNLWNTDMLISLMTPQVQLSSQPFPKRFPSISHLRDMQTPVLEAQMLGLNQSRCPAVCEGFVPRAIESDPWITDQKSKSLLVVQKHEPFNIPHVLHGIIGPSSHFYPLLWLKKHILKPATSDSNVYGPMVKSRQVTSSA